MSVNKYNFETYLSPFTWRYGSVPMRYIHSEQHKYELWRKIWLALAKAQCKVGLVTEEEFGDLKKHEKEIDIERILEIEKETKHDVVAAIKEFAEKAKVGGGKIHLGATSMDIVDNADILRIKESLLIIEDKLQAVLSIFSKLIKKYADFPCLGYTHLQPAEPTTVGYRLAFYAQDLLNNLIQVRQVLDNIKGKGFKGAVGTSASYKTLLQGRGVSVDKFEKEVTKSLGLDPILISNQTYPRQFDFNVLSALASICSSLAKFAGDLRILQSPNFGEWSEPFGEKQVGSSAMPFKKNPIDCENICSLTRYVAKLPQVALENATLSYLERTLDDSANRRIILADSFLATDQVLMTAEKILSGLVINKNRIQFNLKQYAPFVATEAILMEAVKRGGNRQEMHEVLRNISMAAWTAIQEGKPNPMEELLTNSQQIKKYLKKDDIKKMLDVRNHTGNAMERARKQVRQIKRINEK
jgi:adenylosuccinate lyase